MGLVLFVGTGARLGLSFLTGVLIARNLGPADFGTSALLTALVGIAGVITDFGLTKAAVKSITANWPGARPKALTQAQVYFWLRCGTAGLGIAAGTFLAPIILRYVVRLPDDGTESLLKV